MQEIPVLFSNTSSSTSPILNKRFVKVEYIFANTAIEKGTGTKSANYIKKNRSLHRALVTGVGMEPFKRTPVQQLKSADLPGGVSRKIGEELTHTFDGCGHSVEKDHCMFPPTHTKDNIILKLHNENVVRYKGLCSACEARFLVPSAIVAGAKEQVVKSLGADMEVKVEGKPIHSLDHLTLHFASKKKKSTDEWKKFDVQVTPEIDEDQGKGARQWRNVFVEIDGKSLTFITMDLVTKKLIEYEQKWNKPPAREPVAIVVEQQQQQRQCNPPQRLEQPDDDFQLFQDYFSYGDPEFFEGMDSISDFGSSF